MRLLERLLRLLGILLGLFVIYFVVVVFLPILDVERQPFEYDGSVQDPPAWPR